MTKRSEAKYKIDRRMGQNIWGRPKSPVNRREYGPGQHGQRRKGKLSDFGVQLRAKQKLKGYYANISERQFHGIYVEAGRMKGDTGENLIGLLERRLDTVVFRAKFVATMFAARQFINHGHVKVNGRRVNIGSYQLKVGDTVEVKEASKQLTHVLEANQLAERDVPDYIEADHSKMTAKFAARPGPDGRAVRGADGAASDRRILFALIGCCFVISKAPVLPGPFCCYTADMTRLLEEAFSTVATLPDARQDELARVMLQLAGVDQPPIQLTAEEEADLAEAEAEVERGELATPEEVRAMWAKHGL